MVLAFVTSRHTRNGWLLACSTKRTLSLAKSGIITRVVSNLGLSELLTRKKKMIGGWELVLKFQSEFKETDPMRAHSSNFLP